jgi:hypothetical protein
MLAVTVVAASQLCYGAAGALCVHLMLLCCGYTTTSSRHLIQLASKLAHEQADVLHVDIRAACTRC